VQKNKFVPRTSLIFETPCHTSSGRHYSASQPNLERVAIDFKELFSTSTADVTPQQPTWLPSYLSAQGQKISRDRS